jgi:protoporphyrinogen oxidase
MEEQRTALIIGAGPAGLTAALELLRQTNVKPIIVEKSNQVGGISATYDYNGNKIDVGGHRFFTKSKIVMDWWLDILPVQRLDSEEKRAAYKWINPDGSLDGSGPDPDVEDKVMLLKRRKSRIFYNGQFFDYPLQLDLSTAKKLGAGRVIRMALSYLKSVCWPVRPEKSLEDFFVNRFGWELYNTFFRSYTEKLWGVSCNKIDPKWGKQRIKGLSVGRAAWHFIQGRLGMSKIKEKTETSLIDYFLYPKYGPGQLWEEVAKRVRLGGGELVMQKRVDVIRVVKDRVVAVEAVDELTGEKTTWQCDYVVSSMPVSNLIEAIDDDVPVEVKQIASELPYRDFITVGVLAKISDFTNGLDDNWIYIQEPSVRMGRVQFFNNWSPYMVSDVNKTWLGLEYFCSEGDELWVKSDEEVVKYAVNELQRMHVIKESDVVGTTVIRVRKAYPAYFGAYEKFDQVRAYTDRMKNLFLVGRNGMHCYNNQDHSMMAAMEAVSAIKEGGSDKSNIWAVNTEEEYHEEPQAVERANV